MGRFQGTDVTPGGSIGVKNMVLQFLGVVFIVSSLQKDIFIDAYGTTVGIIASLGLLIVGALFFLYAKGLKYLDKFDKYYHKFIYAGVGLALIGYLVFLFIL